MAVPTLTSPQKPLLGSHNEINNPDLEKGAHAGVGCSDHFEKEITSIKKSLDFPHCQSQPSTSTIDTDIEHDRRQIESENVQSKEENALSKDEEEYGIHLPKHHGQKQIKEHPSEMAAEKVDEKATFWQCAFNLANILMGTGMLGLPFVYKSVGWIGGTMVIILFGSIMWRTSILLGRELNGDPRPCHKFDDSPYESSLIPGSSASARMRKPITSFPQIARDAFGEKGCICISSVLYFELFSVLCIFIVSLGDHLHLLIPSISMTSHMIIVAHTLIIPTALLRTPRHLSYLSVVGTVATIAVVLAVVLTCLIDGDKYEEIAISKGRVNDRGHYHDLWISAGLPLALGLVGFTFSGHAVVPSIYCSMKKPQDFEKMVSTTFLVVVGCCILTAVSGYYMFGNEVEDQVTLSLKATAGAKTELAMKMLTWLMILTAFSKFTLAMYPLSRGLEEIVAPHLSKDTAIDITSAAVKIILIALALLVAIFVPSFSFLCSIVGLFSVIIVAVIFPAAAHLKLFGARLSIFEKIVDWLMVIGGSVVAIIGTIATMRSDIGE